MPAAQPTRMSAAIAREMRAHSGEAAKLLRALANPQRLEILCALAEGDLTVSDLNKRVDLSQSALSQHLAVLRSGGIVRTRRESQNIHYSLNAGPAARLIETLHSIYCGSGTSRVRRPSREAP